MKFIILAGVPESDKLRVLESLEKLAPVLPAEGTEDFVPKELALGSMSDYRTELLLATQRAAQHNLLSQEWHQEEDTPDLLIFRESLLDSLAYVITRYRRMVEAGMVSQQEIFRWWLTLQTVGNFFKDTFVSDCVVYIPVDTDDTFYRDINETFKIILDEFKIAYITLEEDQLQSEDINDTILLGLNGQESTNSESSAPSER